MDVYKDSNGDYVCKICFKPHLTLQLAIDCSTSHVPQPPAIDEKNKTNQVILNSSIDAYHEDVKADGTIKAAERLMLSLIEDYVVSRDRDLSEKGRVGALTLNLGKLASEATNNYNKIVFGTKSTSASVSMHLEGTKKSDLDALKEMLAQNGKIEHK
jgi:hypothetical protein